MSGYSRESAIRVARLFAIIYVAIVLPWLIGWVVRLLSGSVPLSFASVIVACLLVAAYLYPRAGEL